MFTSLLRLAGVMLSLAVAVTIMPWSAHAVIFDGFIEGPIIAVNAGAGTMTVNGIVVNVPVSTPIASATRDDLTLADLGTAPAFPGRSQNGFIGGTCLCAVRVDSVTGVHTATEITVEPAENVLITTTRSTSCSNADCTAAGDSIKVGSGAGIQVKPSTDPRMRAEWPTTRGFALDMAGSNLVGAIASMEGYVGNDGIMYYVEADFSEGTLLHLTEAEVSIESTRTQCRQRDGLAAYNLRGYVHTPSAGTVLFYDTTNDPATLIGIATAVTDPEAPLFGAWSLDATQNGNCAASIRATFGTATTESKLAVRIE